MNTSLMAVAGLVAFDRRSVSRCDSLRGTCDSAAHDSAIVSGATSRVARKVLDASGSQTSKSNNSEGELLCIRT
jgi:hypothetical protein